MDSVFSFVYVLLIYLIGFAIIFGVIAAAAYLVTKYERDRIQHLKRLFGENIVVKRSFPLNQHHEEVAQGVLWDTLQSFRELIAGHDWLFIQVTNRHIPNFTLTNDTSATPIASIYATKLDHYTPFIIVRNTTRRAFFARYLQERIDDGEMVWCEGQFDKDHTIYNEPGFQLDTLSILSPEVLESLANAPGGADIILKRNQLYYFLPGNQPAESILEAVRVHSEQAKHQLNDNLARWAKSSYNAEKIATIKSQELSVTLREQFERRRQ